VLDRLERGMPKDIPYVDTFKNDKGWFSTWGDYMIKNDSLSLQTNPDQTGTAVVLDGTRLWRDYSFRTEVESPRHTGALLWVRLKDNENNAACNFGNSFVHVEEILAGKRTVIKGERSDDIVIPGGKFTMEARVSDRTLGCYLNGKMIVESEFLDPALDEGGVGIKIWDDIVGFSSLIVHEVTVLPLNAATSTTDES